MAATPAAPRMPLAEAICQFAMAVTTEEAPLLIFLDDLQWADEGTLALLHALARSARGLRLVILGTYREMELNPRHPLERTSYAMNRELAGAHLVVEQRVRREGGGTGPSTPGADGRAVHGPVQPRWEAVADLRLGPLPRRRSAARRRARRQVAWRPTSTGCG